MDTLKTIREKIKTLSSIVPHNGMPAVVRHIEMAEAHFSRARSSRDDDLFTDVVYRSNHAFEGILKEAYAILGKKRLSNKTPYEIEQYLANTKILKPRVMDLFKNYRTQWRNPSTHEYQLTFTEGEAFLSILSITSFVSILLDQMIERAAFDLETASAERRVPEIRQRIQDFQNMPLLDRVVQSLVAFANEARHYVIEKQEISESQLIGMTHAFLNSVLPDIKTEVEPVLTGDIGNIRPDFVLSNGSEIVIVEVYRDSRFSAKSRQRKQEQMLRYLDAVELSSGIIFEYPAGIKRTAQKYDHIIAEPIDDERMIVWIRPKSTDKL